MLKLIKEYFMSPMAEETPVGIGTVTETDKWDYVLFGNKG